MAGPTREIGYHNPVDVDAGITGEGFDACRPCGHCSRCPGHEGAYLVATYDCPCQVGGHVAELCGDCGRVLNTGARHGLPFATRRVFAQLVERYIAAHAMPATGTEG
jgi:hypothetical protein